MGLWPGSLYCVDPYWGNYDHEDPASHGDRADDESAARGTLDPYKDRVTFHKVPSASAAYNFPSDSLCFVYVDGNHQYECVKQDLETWWPKLCPGGVLAGHDIVCTGEDKGGWGRYVQPAVFAFALKNALVLHFVPETDGSPWSYYFIKPSPSSAPPQISGER